MAHVSVAPHLQVVRLAVQRAVVGGSVRALMRGPLMDVRFVPPAPPVCEARPVRAVRPRRTVLPVARREASKRLPTLVEMAVEGLVVAFAVAAAVAAAAAEVVTAAEAAAVAAAEAAVAPLFMVQKKYTSFKCSRSDSCATDA